MANANAYVNLIVAPYPVGQTSTIGPSWQIVNGYAVIEAGTYTANGLALVWNPITSFSPPEVFYPATSLETPAIAVFISTKGSGYEYNYDAVHNTLRVQVAPSGGGPLVDITAAAAVPSDVIGDIIMFTAYFCSKS